MTRRVAVVGAGAAGLAASYYIKQRLGDDVVLFERQPRVGGHAHTFVVPDGPDAGLPLDIAFMIFNARHYPRFCAWLDALGVANTARSDVSLAVFVQAEQRGYALNWSATADGKRSASFAGELLPNMLQDIRRLTQAARSALTAGELGGVTLGTFLARGEWSEPFIQGYIVPIGASIWSCQRGDLDQLPAERFLRFFDNHGLFDSKNPPDWRHVSGGSHRYTNAVVRALGTANLRLRAVSRVRRLAKGVEITDESGTTETFDAVVLAAHADETLAMLEDATVEEKNTLGAFRYGDNRCVLHCDETYFPTDRALWASWNGSIEANGFCVQSYHLNRLQGHMHAQRDYFVTIEPQRPIRSDRVLFETVLAHPLFDQRSEAAQTWLRNANGTRGTYFCGGYMGNGFHEDAVVSGMAVVDAMQRMKNTH